MKQEFKYLQAPHHKNKPQKDLVGVQEQLAQGLEQDLRTELVSPGATCHPVTFGLLLELRNLEPLL